MAPTIQSGQRGDVDRRQRATDKKSELVCRVKYCNTLPDIPFDPKFITYPFESNRFVQYNPTSLERNYKHDLLTEHDLGVPIDLIDTDTYAIDPKVSQLDLADEKLLEEEISQPQDSKRSRHHAKSVSWLRRTEYISTEYTRFQPSSDKTETKVGYNVKRFFKEQDLYMDRESQIKEIDKTFEDAKINIQKHHTKPGVVPVEILPVFPDFEMWRYPCAQVIFDTDPAPAGRPVSTQLEEMSQAMIRGVMDESGEQFVAYFLPTEETLTKRKKDIENSVEYVDEEEYDYKMAREYNWNVKNKASKGYEENYFFVIRNEGVYYNELETRVRLSKRRLKPGTQPNNSRLIVRHRPLNAAEFKTQEVRLMQLEPPQEEEEEEEPVAENGEDKGSEDDGPAPKRQRVSSDEESEKGKGSDKEEEEEEEGGEGESDKERGSDEEQAAREESEEESGKEAESDREKEDEDGVEDGGRNAKESSDEGEEKREGSEKSENSGSGSSSSSEEESDSEKSSESSDESDVDDQKKRDEEEIFGSDSD